MDMKPQALPLTGKYEADFDSLVALYLEYYMNTTGFNQCRVATKMGLSRATTRKLLRKHFGDLYFRNHSHEE